MINSTGSAGAGDGPAAAVDTAPLEDAAELVEVEPDETGPVVPVIGDDFDVGDDERVGLEGDVATSPMLAPPLVVAEPAATLVPAL